MAFEHKDDAATTIAGRGRILAAIKRVQVRRDLRNGKLIARAQRLVRRNNECRSDKLLLIQMRCARSSLRKMPTGE
jgi:hypothetical protein